jgi:nucleotide-binding universal stress UspA family protein
MTLHPVAGRREAEPTATADPDVGRPEQELRRSAHSRPGVAPAAPVIVGIDGSPGSVAAFGHAARIAERRRAPLLAVIAWSSPPLSKSEPDGAEEARAVLYAAAHDVFGDRLPGWFRASVVHGDARSVLREASLGGQVLIVGDQGRGEVQHGAGSVASMIAAASACPALIFHSAPRRAADGPR